MESDILNALVDILRHCNINDIDCINYTEQNGYIKSIYVYHPMDKVMSIDDDPYVTVDEFHDILIALLNVRKSDNYFGFLLNNDHIKKIIQDSVNRYETPCLMILYSDDDILERWRKTFSKGTTVYYEHPILSLIHFIIFDYSDMKRMNMFKSLCSDCILIPCTFDVAKRYQNDYNRK